MSVPANIVSSAVLFLALSFSTLSGAEDGTWRLNKALGGPEWFTIEGSYRVRYETLDHPFRAGASGSDQILLQRFLLSARVEGKNFYAGAEFEDSRAQFDDGDTPLGTDDVNPAELLRAYVGWQGRNLLSEGDRLDVQGGRITLDVGSRRLSARNIFRNTLNAFTGLHAIWSSRGGTRIQAFYTLPVDRLPNHIGPLARNQVEFDNESLDLRFWGVHADRQQLFAQINGELYLLGLNEDDRPDRPTRRRNLLTPGLRLYIPPSRGAWHFEVEAALQTGTSRESAASAAEVDHRAGLLHGQLGRTLDAAWSPRLEVLYDYASGDDQPGDGENNRFDTLFGARRFEFGPTGIYGALARSNIHSPGFRLTAEPGRRSQILLGYRAAFLASARDAWTTSGLRDQTSSSGSFLGHQMEWRLRFSPWMRVVRLEAGGAWLLAGRFLEEAPNAPGEGNTVYFYTQVNYAF